MGRFWARLSRLWRGSRTALVRREEGPAHLKQFGPKNFLSRWRSNRAIFRDFTTEAAVEKGLRESVWANTCATKTASAVGMARWWVEQEQAGGTWERLAPRDHAAAELVADPNSEWSWSYLIERQILDMQLTGNGLLDITRRPDGTPVALEELNPKNVKPVPASPNSNTDRYVDHYEYRRDDGTTFDIATANVIHMQFPDPDDVYWGMGRLEAAARVIDIDVNAQKSQKVGLDNQFVPPGFFVVTGPGGRPVPKDIAEKQRDQFSETYVGAAKAKKIPFFSADMKYQRLSDTPKDMDLLGGRQLSAEEICAAFWTPPPIAGILRKAIYNNITTLRIVWWEDVITAYLDAIAEWMNHNFIAREWPGERLRLVYSISHVPALRAVVAAKIAQAASLVNDLNWTAAEAEAFVGLVRPNMGA